MSAWVNRTVLSGSSVDPNGTNSHTCTFTPATSGNVLVAIVAGAITSTTPSGWTLVQSAVNYTGLYVFSKTAGSGESSFTTTHNGSNYPIEGVVYEYYAGSAVTGTPDTAIGMNGFYTGPACTGLSGTYTGFSARSWVLGSNPAITASCTWTVPSTEDYDAYTSVSSGADNVELTIAYDDGVTGSSFTPSSSLATVAGGSGEGISFALSVAAPPPASYSLGWVTLLLPPSPTPTIVGTSAGGGGNNSHNVLPNPTGGYQAGDLILAAMYLEPDNEHTSSWTYGSPTPPTGYTFLPLSPQTSNDANAATQNTQRVYVWYRWATGTETSGTTIDITGYNSPWASAAGVLVIRGAVDQAGGYTGTPYMEGASAGTSTGNGNFPALSLSTANVNNLLIYLASDWNSTQATLAGWTETGGTEAYWLYKTQAVSGSTGTIQPTNGTSDNLLTGMLISLRGAP